MVALKSFPLAAISELETAEPPAFVAFLANVISVLEESTKPRNVIDVEKLAARPIAIDERKLAVELDTKGKPDTFTLPKGLELAVVFKTNDAITMLPSRTYLPTCVPCVTLPLVENVYEGVHVPSS